MVKGYKQFIEKMAKQVNLIEGVPDQMTVNITPGRFKVYHELRLSERLAMNEALKLLSLKVEGMTIKFAPQAFEEEELLQSIVLTKPIAFLKSCNVSIVSEEIEAAIEFLTDYRFKSPDWAHAQWILALDLWKAGKRAFNCSPAQKSVLKDAFMFVEWIENDIDHEGISMDIRTVSTLLYGRSKRLQEIAGVIAQIYKGQLPESVLSLKPIEVIEFLGVHRFPCLFPIKGCIEIKTFNGLIDATVAKPYLGIAPDGIRGFGASKQPDYVLFIENETTFNRYTREIEDNGWVFYTGGFPSIPWQRMFKQIMSLKSESVPVYHWGDIDVGGYRILCFMSGLLQTNLIPFMMSPADLPDCLSKVGSTQVNLQALKNALECETAAIAHLKKIVSDMEQTQTNIPWIEQEHFTICSPLSV